MMTRVVKSTIYYGEEALWSLCFNMPKYKPLSLPACFWVKEWHYKQSLYEPMLVTSSSSRKMRCT
uniref:Uncharacterized protein n=1 Tax=Anguilla anguilla TaxID=7936 RepID=A0A0E9P9I7_ANGAN